MVNKKHLKKNYKVRRRNWCPRGRKARLEFSSSEVGPKSCRGPRGPRGRKTWV